MRTLEAQANTSRVICKTKAANDVIDFKFHGAGRGTCPTHAPSPHPCASAMHISSGSVCMCACSGHNSSILHYGHAGEPNEKQIRDGDMWWVLLADVTATATLLQSLTPLLIDS